MGPVVPSLLAFLESLAARGHSLLIVGPRPDAFATERTERLFALPNVRWVGPQPFGALPSYLRVIDVGLVPYVDSPFNRASCPLKTLEYLAAGRAAVATDLPSIRWLDTDLVDVASGPRDFATAVEAAFAAPRTPELVRRRQAFARRHSWDVRAEQFARVLGLDRRVPASRC